MTMTYNNSRGDLLAFQLQHLRRSPSNWLAFALVGLMFFLMASEQPLAMRIGATVIFLLLALPFLLAFYVALLTLNLLLRKDRISLAETVTLDDAGLQIQTATSFQEHQWAGIKKVCRTRRHLFIYLTPSIACVVLRRVRPSTLAGWACHGIQSRRLSGFAGPLTRIILRHNRIWASATRAVRAWRSLKWRPTSGICWRRARGHQGQAQCVPAGVDAVAGRNCGRETAGAGLARTAKNTPLKTRRQTQ